MTYKYSISDKQNTVTVLQDKGRSTSPGRGAVQQSLCWLTRANTNLRQVLSLPRSVQAGFLTLLTQLILPHSRVPFPCQPPCAIAAFQLMNERILALLLLLAGWRNPANQSSIFFPFCQLGLYPLIPQDLMSCWCYLKPIISRAKKGSLCSSGPAQPHYAPNPTVPKSPACLAGLMKVNMLRHYPVSLLSLSGLSSMRKN